MNKQTAEIVEETRQLPPAERLEVVDAILDSLDQPDPEIDRLWLQEIKERMEAFRKGEMEAFPMDEVMARLRAT
ncbi:MAG: addiction module protein [Magnetococcales bacterium]|nr:addiction module protein [Magnetococcales bacterium]